MSNLIPIGWTETKLDDIAEWASGGTPSRTNSTYFTGDIPWIKTGELGAKYVLDADEKITQEAVNSSAAKVFPKGSVGIAMYGATIGKLSIWGVSASTNQACAVAQPISKLLFNEFLYYFLLSQRRALVNSAKGGAQPNISQGALREWPICLPPINEQHRIVGKIEELFSELDEGIVNLKRARAQLAVYRQALLKHAFEGKLTVHWRATHTNQLESAEQHTSEDLNDLPSEWSWQRLENISAVSGGLTKNPKREELPKKMKYLRVANVYADRLDLDDIREIGVTEDEARRLILVKGDLLVVEGNGSIEQIGRVAEWLGTVPCCAHQNHLIRVRLPEVVKPRFVLRFLQSPKGRAAVVKAASSTTGLHTLSISKVGGLCIPVAPLREQQALLDVIEPIFDHIANLEAEIETNLQKSEALRQSILKKAFAGELVPQDPNDEPAAELLARIRAERAAQTAAPKPRKTRAAKA